MAGRNRDFEAYFLLQLQEIMQDMLIQIIVLITCLLKQRQSKRRCIENSLPRCYSLIERIPAQVQYLNRMIHTTDSDCIHNLRMDRNTFGKLCHILRVLGGLENRKYVSIEEQVAMFLGILSHHKKNSVVSFNFRRSGQTVSTYLHQVLKAIINLHQKFLVKPTPVEEDCTDPRWKWFKGCLGALDGTYINVMLPNTDKPRYRTRKGQICTNTLACCDRNLNFIYVLAGWEGSAADGRVLRDALNRVYGLKVPRGNYFLCDNGYANAPGFLTPYKGVRYHLKEWGPNAHRPQNPTELYNLKHTKARNVIERAFGIMKMRWGILRSATFYPIKTQVRLIMACFLLHNFIRSEMAVDPVELMLGEDDLDNGDDANEDEDNQVDDATARVEWNHFRDELANQMWASRV